MIRSTSLPLVSIASSPAFSNSRNARRISLWSFLSITMASLDMGVLLSGRGGGGRDVVATRVARAAVGGSAQPAYGRGLLEPGDLVDDRVEGQVLLTPAGRQAEHGEGVPRAVGAGPRQLVDLRPDRLGGEDDRTGVRPVGQQRRHRPGLRPAAGGQQE